MTYTPTSPLLFRFSALTFNGHKIHYDRDWTQRIENHPDLVVHGPLTAALLVDIAAMAAERKGLQLGRFDYRATHPMYVDREIRLEVNESESGQVSLVAKQYGNMGMKATAVFA
jgi:hydroxyacyl-ACP dehydratase HTD2-like protein with hotdog domain